MGYIGDDGLDKSFLIIPIVPWGSEDEDDINDESDYVPETGVKYDYHFKKIGYYKVLTWISSDEKDTYLNLRIIHYFQEDNGLSNSEVICDFSNRKNFRSIDSIWKNFVYKYDELIIVIYDTYNINSEFYSRDIVNFQNDLIKYNDIYDINKLYLAISDNDAWKKIEEIIYEYNDTIPTLN